VSVRDSPTAAVVEITELMLTSGIEKHRVPAEEHVVFTSEGAVEGDSS
jgi:predicted transcriptional regulator YdeE